MALGVLPSVIKLPQEAIYPLIRNIFRSILTQNLMQNHIKLEIFYFSDILHTLILKSVTFLTPDFFITKACKDDLVSSVLVDVTCRKEGYI